MHVHDLSHRSHVIRCDGFFHAGRPGIMVARERAPVTITVAGDRIYWTESAGVIKQVALDGGGERAFPVEVDRPNGIAITNEHIYFSN